MGAPTGRTDTSSGMTPLQHAERRQLDEITALLRDAR
jgi:hypothetical protein